MEARFLISNRKVEAWVAMDSIPLTLGVWRSGVRISPVRPFLSQYIKAETKSALLAIRPVTKLVTTMWGKGVVNSEQLQI
jgi:hypothetical protein